MNAARRLNFSQRALTSAVRAYRYFLSPWLGSSCRFEPTCSSYALQAIKAHGAATGSYMTLYRLVRCHPWCEAGHDPVPAMPHALFRLFTDSASKRSGAPAIPSTDRKTSP